MEKVDVVILKAMLKSDLDYFDNVDDAEELQSCKDAIEGDKMALQRLEESGSIEQMSPLELYAVKRIMELYGIPESE